jgi:hypothetical protein
MKKEPRLWPFAAIEGTGSESQDLADVEKSRRAATKLATSMRLRRAVQEELGSTEWS